MIPWSRMRRALVTGVFVTAIAFACLAGAAFAEDAATTGTPQAAEPAPVPAPAAAERGATAKAKLPEGGRWLATIVARVLGMDPEEVANAQRAGKPLAQMASERGMSEQQLVESVMKRVEERLNALVSRGALAKREAERLRSEMRERLKALLSRTGAGAPEGADRPERGGGALRRAMQRGFLRGYQEGWKQGFKCGIEMRARLGARMRKAGP